MMVMMMMEVYISMAKSENYGAKQAERRFQHEFNEDVKQRTKQLASEGAIALDSNLRVRTRAFVNLHPRPLKVDDNPLADPELITPHDLTFKYQTFYFYKSMGKKIPRKENEYYVINAPFYDREHCRYGSYEDLLARGGEWAKWLVTYTNLTPRLFEIAKQNECTSFPLSVNWDKLADAQGSDIFTFEGLVRKIVKDERDKDKDNNKDKEEEE